MVLRYEPSLMGFEALSTHGKNTEVQRRMSCDAPYSRPESHVLSLEDGLTFLSAKHMHSRLKQISKHRRCAVSYVMPLSDFMALERPQEHETTTSLTCAETKSEYYLLYDLTQRKVRQPHPIRQRRLAGLGKAGWMTCNWRTVPSK